MVSASGWSMRAGAARSPCTRHGPADNQPEIPSDAFAKNTDWGCDTMISLSSLALVTGQFDETLVQY